MTKPTVIPGRDPRARTLLGSCLILSCGFFVLELILYLFLQGVTDLQGGLLQEVLIARYGLLSLGRTNLAIYGAVGLLVHAGMAAFMSLALQRLWLRSRGLALSVGLLLFAAFEGSLVAASFGTS